MTDNLNFTNFDKDGNIRQIENALKAVKNGDNSIAIKCKDSIILISEKNHKNTLVDYDTIKKNEKLTELILANYSGINADFRVLLKKGRKKCMEYALKYSERVPISYIVREMADVTQEYTQAGGVRPFGVSLLLGSVEDNKPYLYQLDCSGSYYQWNATAIGKSSNQIKIFLEKKWKENLSTYDGITIGLRALKDEFEGDIKVENFDISIVSENKIEHLNSEEKLNYLQNIQQF